MRNLFLVPLIAVLSVFSTMGACKALAPVPNQILSCVEGGAASGVISAVGSALGSSDPNWATTLENLGVTYGLSVVECVVADLIGDLSAPDAGANGAVAPIAIVRGQAWLAAHGVVKAQRAAP